MRKPEDIKLDTPAYDNALNLLCRTLFIHKLQKTLENLSFYSTGN